MMPFAGEDVGGLSCWSSHLALKWLLFLGEVVVGLSWSSPSPSNGLLGTEFGAE
jgi:hypothetical protein